MDVHRERARRESTVESVEDVEALDAATEVQVESQEIALVRREQDARLRQALNNLPSKLREPFILRFLHDMAYEEIAERLNLTPANVRKRIQQAREKLKEILNKSA
jgi:RNA polymerase sigma-70 factor (ECF subfamily)